MPTTRLPKRKSAKAAKSARTGTALDQAQQKLLEEQRQVQAQIDALQQALAETPSQTPPRRKPASEPYLTGPHGPRAHYRHAAVLAGASYMESPSMASRPRKRSKPAVLRREKAEGRVQTVALLIALVVALGWLATRYF